MTKKQKIAATVGLMIIGVLSSTAAEKMFSVCTIPDTQRGQHNVAATMEWIGQNKAALNIAIFTPHDPGWIGSFDGSTPNLDFMMCGHHGTSRSYTQYNNFKYWLTGHQWNDDGSENWDGRTVVYTFYPDQNKVTVTERGTNGELLYQYAEVPLVMNPTTDDATVIYGGTHNDVTNSIPADTDQQFIRLKITNR